ncbi:MAG TPA: M1 family aminopeptidase [Bacteroidota bacterium]|jgi:aminopeptidase N
MTSRAIPLLFLFVLPLARAQENVQPVFHPERDRTYHVLHYKLNITVDEQAKTCAGEVAIRLVPLRPLFDELRLDAAEMKVSGVKLGRESCDYRLEGEGLIVDLKKPYGPADTLAFVVSYSVASPRKGLYFVGPDSGYPDKKWQVWSQGEAEDNHFWFPCYDYPNDFSTSEMIVTVNDRFTAISNGRLLDVRRDRKSHTATFHWLEGKPHVSYLISLVAGEYVEVKDSWGTVPISSYVTKEQEPDAMRSFGKTPKMIEFFSAKTGVPYPWEKFAQTAVEDFIYGGEENVSAVTLSDATIHDARAHLDYSSDGLVAHELAHMWWGDLLTCRDWSHAWLNEGFATYFQNAFTEYDLGKDRAAKEILDNQAILRNLDDHATRRPTVLNKYVAPMELFESHIYGKGAVVLNMLRFILGEEPFWSSIRHYANKFAFRNVETNDFKVAIQEATGANLHWFFDEWLYKAGYPMFDITSKWDQESRSLRMTARQIQRIDSLTGLFTTPVEVQVWVHDEPVTYRITISKQEETFSFPAYQQPQLVIFDKGSRILKKAIERKSLEEWIYQLRHAEDGVDRFLAVDELQGYVDSGVVLKALSRAMLDDRFSEVRREAAWAIGDEKAVDVSDTLIAAYGDLDSKVRNASVTSLGRWKGEKVESMLRHAFERDSSYDVAASALRSLAKVDSFHRNSYCEAALKRPSRNEVIRIAALQVLSEAGDDSAFQIVKSYTRYGVDRAVRIPAIGALASGWKKRSGVVDYLIGLLGDPSFHARRAVIAALSAAGDARAVEPLRQRAAAEADGRVAKEARDAAARIEQLLKKDSGKDSK